MSHSLPIGNAGGKSEWPDGWPDSWDEECDGYEIEPTPAAVLSKTGRVLGRFADAPAAVAAMHHWPQAYLVLAGGCIIACRQDRQDLPSGLTIVSSGDATPAETAKRGGWQDWQNRRAA